MNWILRRSNEKNAEVEHRAKLQRNAPVLWENLCHAIEQAVNEYRKLPGWSPVEFSGKANHAVVVTIFEEIGLSRGPERERISFTFDSERCQNEIESHLRNR